ncbi:MAG: TonB-dependent receptor plug domain-containing protein [Bacteroidales bacterium]
MVLINKTSIILLLGIFWVTIFNSKGYSQEVDTINTQMLFNLSLDDLMNIEIESSVKQKQNISEAPSVVTVITARQIRERGYLSISEALNSSVGFDVITDYFQPNLGIRGINGGMRSWSRLAKVMIDGQPVAFRSSSDNYLDLSLIPIEMVEKIEIVRGPNSAIYGKNAFLGVINIITKSGSSLQDNSVSHFGGFYQNKPAYGISTLIGGQQNKIDFVLSSTIAQFDFSGLTPKNIPGSDIYSANNISEQAEILPFSVFAKLRYLSESFGDLSLDISHQNINHKHEFADWGALTHHNRINLKNSYGRLRYARDLFSDFQLNMALAFSQSEPSDNEILDTDGNHAEWIIRELKTTSVDVSGDLLYAFNEENNFTLGIDYTADLHDYQKYYTISESNDKILNPGGSDGPNNFNNLGVFLQLIINPASFFNLNFLKDLTITAGYRFDFHCIYEDVLTYRLAAVYPFTKSFSTKLMYGTSFNAPSPAQLYTNAMFTGDIVGNPELKPEKAKTIEWALIGRLSDHFSFTTTAFYTTIEDKIEYLLPFGETSNITAANISRVYSAGVESELNFVYNNSTSYLNYSYQKSLNERYNPLLGDIRVKTNIYPQHMIKAGETYKIPKIHLLIHLDGKFISSRKASEQNSYVYDPINYAINSYSLDPYFIFDLNIQSTDIRLFTDKESILSLKIENLLNHKYYYPGFSDFDIPGLGRSVIAKITQTL